MWILLIVALTKLIRERRAAMDGVGETADSCREGNRELPIGFDLGIEKLEKIYDRFLGTVFGETQKTKREETVAVHYEQETAPRQMAVHGNPAARDSLENCILTLRQRFAGRGMVECVRRDMRLQTLAAMSTRRMAPSAYPGTAVSDRFRTGVSGGERYMTSADYVRYYTEHRRKSRPDADLEGMSVKRGTGLPVVGHFGPASAPAYVSENAKRTASRIVSKLPAGFREKHPTLERRTAEVYTLFAGEEVRKAPEHTKRRFPISVASAILVTVMSLSLVVGGTVMYSDANARYRAASEVLEATKTEEANLERELGVKLDLVGAESYARDTLGMVDRAYADGSYLDGAREERIEVYEEEKPSFGLSTLLSVFGFGG